MQPDYITDTSTLDHAIAYIIQRTSRLLRFNLAKFFERTGANISPEHWFLLFRLYERPGQAQGELADRELNDHPNITRLLDALERRGLVARTPDPNDRRRSLVALTAAGEQLMHDLLPLVVAERKRIFGSLTPAETQALVAALKKIEHNLTEH
jgi:DNA-binding MarR family transcriptional regulator